MVTLTNITGYTETSRDIRSVKSGLDEITSVWTGQTSQLIQFLPNYGSPHPSFPLMKLYGLSVKDQAGGVLSDVTAIYKGRITTNGQARFLSEYSISEQWTEKEFSYQTQDVINSTKWFSAGTPFINQGQVPQVVIAWTIYGQSPAGAASFLIIVSESWSVRYLTNTVSIRYCCNFDPNGIGQFQSIGLARCAMEEQVIVHTGHSVSSCVGANEVPKVSGYGIQSQMVNQTVNQINGWYTCNESYETRWVSL
jgi:hypothetical protein